MNQKNLYKKYKKYLRIDLSKVKISVDEKILILNFEKEIAYYSEVNCINGDDIYTYDGICFNIRNKNHGYADFIPVKFLLEQKINKLLNI